MTQITTCFLKYCASIFCSAKISHVLTINQTDILVIATHMDYCKEKFQESVLPKITVVQNEVCPSFPAEDNPNGVTSACDQFCTLWT